MHHHDTAEKPMQHRHEPHAHAMHDGPDADRGDVMTMTTMMMHQDHQGYPMDTTRSSDISPFDHDGKLSLGVHGSPNSTQELPFCKPMRMGGGMIMYMDGFRFSLKGNQTCLNLLFPSWTLDTKMKFGGAMVVVFLAAMFVEGFSKFRHQLVRSVRRRRRQQQQQQQQQQGRVGTDGGNTTASTKVRMVALHWTITILHGLQALFGYVLMLVTMTFSIELLLAAVFGLAAGYAVFYQTQIFSGLFLDTTTTTNQVDGVNGSDVRDNQDDEAYDGDYHVTSTPCCEFMVEESCEDSTSQVPMDGQGSNDPIDLNVDENTLLLPTDHVASLSAAAPSSQSSGQARRRPWRSAGGQANDNGEAKELMEPLVAPETSV